MAVYAPDAALRYEVRRAARGCPREAKQCSRLAVPCKLLLRARTLAASAHRRADGWLRRGAHACTRRRLRLAVVLPTRHFGLKGRSRVCRAGHGVAPRLLARVAAAARRRAATRIRTAC
jgi:hypothetical protein